MIILLWILLTIIPSLIGCGVMTIVYKKRTEFVIGFSDCFLNGFMACIGVTAVSHVIGMFGKLSLSQTSMLMFIMMTMLTFVAAGIGLYGVAKNKDKYFVNNNGEEISAVLPLSFLGIFFLQILFVFCMKALVTPGDITLETVQSFLANDGIYRVMPLTGVANENGMPIRYTILCLPTLYAVLAQSFGLEAELVICHVIPVVVLGATYLSYFRLSECLFGKQRLRKRYCFLLMVALVLTFSEGAVFLDGYAALHAGYLGTSIRNLVLAPYALCAVLEKRYWKAVLCILAEACIAWTFWGCGVCVIVVLGILILEILEKKVPAIARFLQIFQEKEA